MSNSRYLETLYAGVAQSLEIGQLLFEQDTGQQSLVIFQNPLLGTVMALDGVIQTTEKDEFIYHEMLTHVPMLTHENPKRVLIIGGGDGGIAREVLKHPVSEVVMVEIDPWVVDLSKKYFPGHSRGAFEDPRLKLVFDDGAHFVQSSKETFDVIISDSTDPIGPGEVLFQSPFYAACENRLSSKGVMSAQNGVPFFQMDELRNTHARAKLSFPHCTFYRAPVPTYYGGDMALALMGKQEACLAPELSLLQSKAKHLTSCQFYDPKVHLGALALPPFWRAALKG